jgi:transposase InsO family protein
MSGKGNCYDNAAMESFFKTLKTELVYLECFQTKPEARTGIFDYIEIFYNRQRLHSSLGFLTPEEFEDEYWKMITGLQNVA